MPSSTIVRSLLLLVSTAALISPSFATYPDSAEPDCYQFIIPVSSSTSVRKLPAASNLTDSASVDNWLQKAVDTAADSVEAIVTGDYNISARYCEPKVKVASRQDTIQLLVHGITLTKTYWSGLGFPGYEPEKYSWIRAASANGYPTVAIDRVGNGNSTRPDPLVDQINFQVKLLSQVAQALRDGNGVPRKFSKVVYVGHSLGSVIGHALAAQYPTAIDALLLTGYSPSAAYNIVLESLPIPANLESPTRFAGLSPGYLQCSLKDKRGVILFGRDGTYDPKFADLDWPIMDTASLGEFLTIDPADAPSFTGPVGVITGEQDDCFCSNLTTTGVCGQGPNSLPASVGNYFPSTSNFTYWIPENIGHCLNWHYKAPEVYAYAHKWIQDQGY